MTMHRRSLVLGLLVAVLLPAAFGQIAARTEVKVPEIPGYVVLKCDFHMHTVFSDGNVWPPVRAEEAWREGLDSFSVTDHIEYLPHKDDMKINHNRPFELVRGRAQALNMLVDRGSEITRDVPPGHFNAIILRDCNPGGEIDPLQSRY